MNKIILIILVIFFYSCKEKQELKEDVNTKVFYAYLDGETASPSKLSDFWNSISFIPIASDSNTLIANIADVRYFDGNFYILDSKTVSIIKVDQNGKIVSVLSKRGRAPGEYLNIDIFDINPSNGEINVYDLASKQIIIYDNSGNFKRNVLVQDIIRDFAVFLNGEYIFYTPDFMKGNRRGLWRVDSLGNFKEQLVYIDEDFRYGGIYPKYLHRINDDVVGLMGGEDYDRVYHIKEDSITVPYKLNIDRKIPEELKSSDIVDYERHAGLCYTKNNYLETDKLLMLTVTDMKKRLLLLYDKVSQEVSYVRKEKDLIEDIDVYTMPKFGNNGVMIGVLDVGFILNFKELREKFPYITTDSNPVLVVCSN